MLTNIKLHLNYLSTALIKSCRTFYFPQASRGPV